MRDRSRQRGIGLIEAVVAAVILGMTSVGLTLLFNVSISGQDRVDQRTQVRDLGNRLEQLIMDEATCSATFFPSPIRFSPTSLSQFNQSPASHLQVQLGDGSRLLAGISIGKISISNLRLEILREALPAAIGKYEAQIHLAGVQKNRRTQAPSRRALPLLVNTRTLASGEKEITGCQSTSIHVPPSDDGGGNSGGGNSGGSGGFGIIGVETLVFDDPGYGLARANEIVRVTLPPDVTSVMLDVEWQARARAHLGAGSAYGFEDCAPNTESCGDYNIPVRLKGIVNLTTNQFRGALFEMNPVHRTSHKISGDSVVNDPSRNCHFFRFDPSTRVLSFTFQRSSTQRTFDTCPALNRTPDQLFAPIYLGSGQATFYLAR